MKELAVIHLGRTHFREAWEFQKLCFALRMRGEIPDVLLLTEHDPVYTFGKGSDENHLLASKQELMEQGVDVVHTDRGGDVTYHGPGQLVGYPILDLSQHYRDVHRYLRDIEEVIIQTLDEFSIRAMRDQEYTGVWVGNNKIAAIGVKVSRWITMHGFALNVNTDLRYFDRIIPCGIFHKGVTSMNLLNGKPLPLHEVSEILQQKFTEVFGSVIVDQEKVSFMTHDLLLRNNFTVEA